MPEREENRECARKERENRGGKNTETLQRTSWASKEEESARPQLRIREKMTPNSHLSFIITGV